MKWVLSRTGNLEKKCFEKARGAIPPILINSYSKVVQMKSGCIETFLSHSNSLLNPSFAEGLGRQGDFFSRRVSHS